MSNSDIVKGTEMVDRESYLFYLRNESLNKLLDPNYVPDKSYDGYRNSKFYVIVGFNYSQYLASAIDKSIDYSDYLSDNLQNEPISYTQYLAEKI